MSVIVGKVWQEVVVHKQTVHLVALGATRTVEASQQIPVRISTALIGSIYHSFDTIIIII